jgi:quinol monooxygenase YgiN
MSTHVVTEHHTQADRTEDVIAILSASMPDSLAHDGCEEIHLRRDQDDPARVVSFTQWASRRHYEDYLAWRTATGLTDEIRAMLTTPISVEYFDDLASVGR